MDTWKSLLLSFLVVSVSSTSDVTYSDGTINLLWSNVYEGNLLPAFMFLQGPVEGGSNTISIGGGRGEQIPFVPSDEAEDDIWEGANPDLRSPQLPWLIQDMWGCERTPTDIETVELESKSLKVTITPQVLE